MKGQNQQVYQSVFGAMKKKKMMIKTETLKAGPVDWGSRIQQLDLCRGVRPHPPTSVVDMTSDNLMVRFQ